MSGRPMLARASTRIALDKATNPPILPIPRVRGGNNVPHSMHKTRRMFKPNTTRYTLPVNVVGGALARRVAARNELANGGTPARKDLFPQFNKVKLTQRQLKVVLKAGGVEGLLLSHPAKHFTPQGKALRNEMFEALHLLRRSLVAPVTEESSRADVEALTNKVETLLIEDGTQSKSA